MMRSLAQTNSRQSLNRFVLVGHAVKILRQHHVLHRGQKRNQVELLKHKSNFLGTHPIQLRRRHAGNILSVQPDLARSRPVEAADQIDQRRFTRPRRSHDRKPFALRHLH